jgi:hypothetical protein
MNVTPELRVTELDFLGIRNNLIQFLRAQDEFVDYDFDGSSLAVLLDILARNTHYNAVLAHLQANEMFLDTAIKRSSVVSIAKTLGYTPRSVSSARARVNLTITPTTPDQTTFVLSTGVGFTSTVNGQGFTFYPVRDYVSTLSDGVFRFTDVTLVEGTPLTNSFVVRDDTRSGPFVIPAANIDTTTLTVSVLSGTTEATLTPVSPSSSIIDVTGEDLTYWMEETADLQYRLVFGDGVVGRPLVVGNIVVATYLASNGPLANGCRLFSVGNLGGATVTIELVSRASGGSDRESIDSIRFYAPRNNTTRNRAVTAQDYKHLILSHFDKAKSVLVWGGETNVPPIYGKVFITIDPRDGYVITEGDLQYLSEVVLRPRAVLSVQHEFVDPDYVYIGVNAKVQYNPKRTSLNPGQMNLAVTESIIEFFDTEVSTLDQTFFYSRFVDIIQATNPAIVSVLVEISLRKKLAFPLNTVVTEQVDFLTPINPGSVRSVQYNTLLNEVVRPVHIHDYPDAIPAKATTGTLWVVANDHTTKLAVAGTVNYQTGIVQLTDLYVAEYLGAAPELVLFASPTDLGKNISPKVLRKTTEGDMAVVPLPSRNTIIALDTSESEALTGLTPGLQVAAIPFIESL